MENTVGSAGKVQPWDQKCESLQEEATCALQFFLLVYLFFFLCLQTSSQCFPEHGVKCSQPAQLEFMVPWKMSHCQLLADLIGLALGS